MKHAYGPYFYLVRQATSERCWPSEPRVGYCVVDASLRFEANGRENCATWERDHSPVPLSSDSLHFTLSHIIRQRADKRQSPGLWWSEVDQIRS